MDIMSLFSVSVISLFSVGLSFCLCICLYIYIYSSVLCRSVCISVGQSIYLSINMCVTFFFESAVLAWIINIIQSLNFVHFQNTAVQTLNREVIKVSETSEVK